VLLGRWITTPLEGIGEDTHHVARGDLERVVRGSGPDEIVRLGADVDQMRGNLVAALAAALTAQEALRAQADRLAEQADDLRRSNAELEQFAYVASHDLQEPLRKVASFCQMLDRRYSGRLDERADQYIAFAVDGAKRMQRLINDLLAFSRVGRTTGGFTSVNLDEALSWALNSLDSAIEESGAQVEADPLPTVHGNPTLLAQVLQNLVGNAVKFRRPDTPPRIEVRAWREDDEWHFRCSDNGIGIEPRYAERVFVIFQRLHAKDAYDGTGIGLAMCRKIIEHHGGRIWLDAEGDDPAVGTTVRWTLPVPGAAPGETETTAQEDMP
jgi:light-regulated signal transduction histidine kinase (bacteriophytochrome)